MPTYGNLPRTGMELFDIGANEQAAQSAYDTANNAFDNINPTVGYQQQGASEYGKISEDPALRAAQMRALSQMQGIADAGGRDAQFRQGMNAAEQSAGRFERGQREALANQARQRGTFGGAQQYAQQLMAQQSGADRAANQGFDTAAAAQQRAQMALQGYGQMSGQIRGQDYGVASQKAQAQDAINAANTRGVNTQNQQNYQNQFNLQNARYGASTAAGNRYSGASRRPFDDIGNVVETVGKQIPRIPGVA